MRTPSIVGRSITLNGNSYDVIGVAPRGFRGALLGDVSDVWLPMALQEEVRPPSAGPLRRRLGGLSMLGVRDVRWLSMVGRLKEGQSVTEAAAALDVVGQRLAAAYPDSNRDLTATAVALGTGPGRAHANPAGAHAACCGRGAGASDRLRERGRPDAHARVVPAPARVAVRMAMGAGRGQLVRQWLTEAVMLGLLVPRWGSSSRCGPPRSCAGSVFPRASI